MATDPGSLSRYVRKMINTKSFLVGIGPIPEAEMQAASALLGGIWGGVLKKHFCEENPNEILQSLPKEDGLVQLLGDAAGFSSEWGSWLEVLGAWRIPTVLMVAPISSGQIPGDAPAYIALCKALSVPLVGIVQIGGLWNVELRRSDGLPWCGWLPDEVLVENVDANTCEFENSLCQAEQVVALLQSRLKNL